MSKIHITLETMVHGGDALGRHEGKVVFVPYGIPGEEVTVEIVEDRKRFSRGRIVEIHAASPNRTQPPCPFFGECGGCHWQHISYETQLEFKQQIVTDQLVRLGKIVDPSVRSPIGMEDPWKYRNNMRFGTDRQGKLGIRARASHRIIPVDKCLIMHPLLQDLLDQMQMEDPRLRQLTFRCGVNTGERMLIFEMQEDEPPGIEVDIPISCILKLSDGQSAVLVGSPYLNERLHDMLFRLSSDSFFQVNTLQTERLISLVKELLAPAGHETLLDAYCGVGSLGLSLADHCSGLIGIEESPSAIEDARANASLFGGEQFYAGKVEEILPSITQQIDLVVLDPPRAGCDRAVLNILVERKPERIVYVSCDAATLARDLKILIDGGYSLREVQPVDMFPQTAHVETVVLLVKNRVNGS